MRKPKHLTRTQWEVLNHARAISEKIALAQGKVDLFYNQNIVLGMTRHPVLDLHKRELIKLWGDWIGIILSLLVAGAVSSEERRKK